MDEHATAAPKPLRKPRRVDPDKFFAGARLGDCFTYAFREALRFLDAKAPPPPMTIVHGVTRNAGWHAWVERGGFAYDWQTFALVGLAPAHLAGGAPIPIDDFYRANEPSAVTRYEPIDVARMVAKYRHAGPWT